jgi:hypothetical protein
MAARKTFFACLFSLATASAQVPDAAAPAPAPAPAPAAFSGSAPVGQAPAAGPAQGGGNKAQSPFGQEVPVFDPGTEVLTFNGKNWNVTNNRIFQARFEKFLNAPEATSSDENQYRLIMDRMLDLLKPGNASPQNVDAAFRLLPYASRFDFDARLCDSLGDAVYSVWQAQRNQARLANANESLEDAARKLEWNMQVVTEGRRLQTAPNNTQSGRNNTGRQGGGGQAAPQGGGAVNPANSTDYQTASYARQLAERLAAIKANQVKKELSELQAKVEFQAMMVQFLMQRRFQHVLLSTRFYRALFTDGDTKLNLGKDATDLFQKSTGMPPTVSLVDSMANEMIRDINEGVKAFEFLLEKGELQGATMRLQEVFVTGEYMPVVRLVPREKKRKTLEFAQKSYQLISAIDVRDYTRAESLVADLKRIASDFDDSKPTQAIEVARVQQRGLLAKARDALLNNDKATFEKALTDAAAIWPNSKEFKEASTTLFGQGDVVQKTLLEFDQLQSQKNFRQIWNDKIRFIAAAAVDPARKAALEKVMNDMQTIESSLLRAEEMARQGVFAGAWETLERAWAQFPDDPKLNQLRADMTTRASEFVKVIRNAEELEKREQFGSALAHYLKAQKLYPASDFARGGIDRLVKQVLPPS